MKIWNNKVFTQALPACLVLLLCFTGAAFALKTGEKAPDILGRKLGGGLFRLSAEKGKPLVLNFFSTNCKPCRDEMPELAALEKKYPLVKVVSIHAEDRDVDAVALFVSKLAAAPVTVVCGSAMVKKDFGIYGFPHTVVIDAKGMVLAQYRGYTPDNMTQLEKVMAGL